MCIPITFSNDIDIKGLIDNQKRPITELFFTVINRGYFGWFNKPIGNTNSALKKGWEFNLGPQLNSWWEGTNSYSNTQKLNNIELSKPIINYSDIINGGTLHFQMTNQY